MRPILLQNSTRSSDLMRTLSLLNQSWHIGPKGNLAVLSRASRQPNKEAEQEPPTSSWRKI